MSTTTIVAFPGPRLTPAPEGGWYCIIGDHGWLVGDRRTALDEFRELVRIERHGR
jgi:hypothetical protein